MQDLIIVGCGPVGAVAANLAARAGLTATVIERSTEVFDLPRAIHFDAHIMRILQQAGVADEMLAATRVWKRSTFYGADGEPIRVHDWADDHAFGWDAHYLFYQPTMEAILRRGLSNSLEIDLRLGVEVVDIEQDAEGVTVRTRECASGIRSEVRGRYLLAADGASSFVRAWAEISLNDNDFDEPWLVIDVLSDEPIGRENESEMFCDPLRPATRIPGPGRHHRWEFMLLPGETAEQLQTPDSIARLLQSWVSLADVEVVRASVYRFHALVAEQWRHGRVFLCGDAAHQTPPFLGQGLCHGIRDVQNLIWKVRAVLRGAPEDLLQSYESERRPHVSRIIGMAVTAGRDICLVDADEAAQRDARMRREMAFGSEPKTTFQALPPLVGGLLLGTGAGELFPQPLVRDRRGVELLLDDAVGDGICAVALTPEAAEVAAALPGLHVAAVGEDASAALAVVSGETAAWFRERQTRIAVLRPDRYVYAVADDVEQAVAAVRTLTVAMTGRGIGSAQRAMDDTTA